VWFGTSIKTKVDFRAMPKVSSSGSLSKQLEINANFGLVQEGELSEREKMKLAMAIRL
jgi:hypothetical protein